MTLNGQLDYFGQAVNLADRIQGVAAANEICISDELYRLPGAADLLGNCRREALPMRVKGVERELVVHRIAGDR